MLRLIDVVKFPVWWLLCRIPFCKYMSVGFQLDRLVENGEVEKAKAVREKWFNKMPEKYASALWRSEGECLLYEEKLYPESFAAFQKAVSIHETHFSTEDSFRLYYGAAVSAVMVWEIDQAEIYYSKFMSLCNDINKNNRFQNYLSRYAEGLQWLRGYIYSDGTRSPLTLVESPKPGK